ncbi:MAG TPA: hypothetical protein VIJ16_00040 [Gemmatimonadaceae bacterium]
MKRLAIGFALLVALPAAAQTSTTKLVLTGFNGGFGNSAVTDFDQGFIDNATAITYTVTLVKSDSMRTTGVYISAAAATMTGGKPTSDCVWRRDDLGTWNPLTTTNTLVESRVVQTAGTVWSNSVWVQCNLNWATDPPAANSVGLTITLQVTP